MEPISLPVYCGLIALAAVLLACAYAFAKEMGFLAFFRRRHVSRIRGILGSLALKFGGEVEDGGTALRFDRNGFPAHLALRPRDRMNTQIAFKLGEEVKDWLTVSSQGMLQAFVEQFGIRDIQVGDASFDQEFEIRASDPGRARKWLKPAVREILFQMNRRYDVLLRINPDQLVVRGRFETIEHGSVDTFCGLAFQLLDLLEFESPTAVVVASVREVLDDETRCPVCGAALSRGRVVRCAKCRAVHHADCWQFNGLCATFACGSREKKAA